MTEAKNLYLVAQYEGIGKVYENMLLKKRRNVLAYLWLMLPMETTQSWNKHTDCQCVVGQDQGEYDLIGC